MKIRTFYLRLLAVLGLLGLRHQADAAIVTRITAYTQANSPVTQVEIMGGGFGPNATVMEGGWTSTGFGYKIEAYDDVNMTTVQITGGTEFTFTIDSSAPTLPQTTNLAGLVFINDPNSPSVMAYDVLGNPINALLGQSVGVDLTPYGVYSVLVGGPEILMGYNGGDFDVNMAGETQTGTLTVGLTTQAGATGSTSATGTLTVVPEPTAAVFLGCLGLLGIVRRRR